MLAHHPFKSRTLAGWERFMMSKNLSEVCTGCSMSHLAVSASLRYTKYSLRSEIKAAKLWIRLRLCLVGLRVVRDRYKNTTVSSANSSSFGKPQCNPWIIDLHPLQLIFYAFWEKHQCLPIHLAKACSALMVTTLSTSPSVDHSGLNSACNDICVSFSTCKP